MAWERVRWSRKVISGAEACFLGAGLAALTAGFPMVAWSAEAGSSNFIERIFAQLDADGDGVLTQDEFMARRAGRQVVTDSRSKRDGLRAKRFAAMDANGDGRVTAEEFAAAARERFSAIDANGDRRITLDEVRSAAGSL